MTTGIYLGQDNNFNVEQAPQVPTTLHKLFNSTENEVWYSNGINTAIYALGHKYEAYMDPARGKQIQTDHDNFFANMQDYINRAPSGIISGAVKLAGSGLGFSLGAENAVTAYSGEALIGKQIEGTLASISAEKIGAESLEGVKKLALRAAPVAAKGAVMGAVLAQPYNVSHMIFGHQIHQDYSFWDAAVNTAQFSALGTFTGAISGMFKSPVDPIIQRQAAEVALSQVVRDTNVDLEPIIKNSLKTEHAKLTPKVVESLEARRDDLTKELDKTTAEVAKSKDALNSKYTEDHVSRETKRMSAHDHIKLYMRAFMRDANDRTEFEKGILANKNIPSEVQRGIKIMKSDEPAIGSKDQDFLDRISPNKEQDFHEKKIDDLNDKKKVLSKKLKTKLSDKIEKSTRKKLDNVKSELSASKLRLKKLPLEESKVVTKHNELHGLTTYHQSLVQNLDETNTFLDYQKAGLESLQGNTLKASLQKIIDPKNEVPFLTTGEKLKDLTRDIPDQPKDFLEDLKSQVKTLKDNGFLTDDDMKEINNTNDELNEQKNYTKLIDQGVECLIRNVSL